MARNTKVQFLIDGVAPSRADINTVATSASQGEDNAVSTVFEAPTYVSGTRQRGVITTQSGLVVVDTGGSHLGGVTILPHTAFVGSNVAGTNNINTATSPGATVQFANGASSASRKRIDIVYEIVTLDVAVVTPQYRKVKDAISRVVSSAATTTQTQNVVTYGVVTGIETTGFPIAPALPADSGNAYIVPLAYVILNGDYIAGTTGILAENIQEIAQVLTLPNSTAPMNKVTQYGSLIFTLPLQTKSTDFNRWAFLPANMAGGALSRYFGFMVGSVAHPEGAFADGTIIDDSIDWRNRAFRYTAQIGANTGSVRNAWVSQGPPYYYGNTSNNSTTSSMGQSWRIGSTSRRTIVRVDQFNSWLPSSDFIELNVDSSGRLVLNISGSGVFTTAAVVFIWIDATGQFSDTI